MCLICEINSKDKVSKKNILNNKKFVEKIVKLKMITCHNKSIYFIPKELVNLRYIDCWDTGIRILPKELVNLKYLDCAYSNVKFIPNTFTELRILDCASTKIKNIPNTFTKLKRIDCSFTKIKYISNTFTRLKQLECIYTSICYIPENIKLDLIVCEDDILFSQKTIKKEPNNSKYLILTRCQKSFRLRLKFNLLKSAFHKNYIIGNTVKNQILKFFKI